MRNLLGRLRRSGSRSLVEQLATLTSVGDGSTLSLDFTTGVLDPRLTFTRSTTGTYIGSDGLVKTMAAAPTNDPTKARFDYDPTTLAPRGLLIEGSANNLARYSETLETTGGWWGYNAATRTVESSDVNPTGATGSISFGPTTNGGSRYCGLFLTGQTTTVGYTYSVWVKAKGTSSLVVTIQNNAGAVNSNARIISQPSGANASFTGSGGGFPQINNLSSTGWTRIELTTTGTLGGTGALNVFMYPNNTSTQTTADTVFAWGAQLEAGSGASSYIPTGASTGNRARDECSITGDSFSSWFTNPNEGSFFVQYSMNYPSASMGAGIDRYAFEISDSAGSSRALCIAAYRNAPAGRNVRVFNPSGTSFDSGDALTTSSALNTKFAFGYATANNYIAAVGVAQAFQTYNTGSLPTSPAINQMWLGTNRNLSSTTYLFGCISLLKYWPTRLPNATLQGLVS